MCSGESNWPKNFGTTLPNSYRFLSVPKHHLIGFADREKQSFALKLLAFVMVKMVNEQKELMRNLLFSSTTGGDGVT